MPEEKNRRPVALVTGGTSGIGLAVAHDLARDHQVYVIGRRRADATPLAGHPNVIPVSLDLRDGEALAAWAAALARLDVLVHSAAVSQPFSVAAATPEIWRHQFDINLFAPAELTRLTLPALRASRGSIVFINSGSGTRPLAGHTVYSASKFALRALAEALRNEEREHGVRVATVYPGPTDTPMNRPGEEDDPLARSSPHSIAKAVRLVIDTDEDSQITEVVVRPRHDPAQR
ncbi:SDR family oxidoreductase [Brenneria izadpanahii]|uniref:SDR family oxidoreductase n=1 Tax=Brenneria izadpanahii TaxID=2722756 RepID=A0ABX7USI4_9GAMM|nr:SDR family oxidoreductase [Brenneria izadpanahii]QTF08678.1 SDR family oxidoreductase [Brenneria izadpanahii]